MTNNSRERLKTSTNRIGGEIRKKYCRFVHLTLTLSSSLDLAVDSFFLQLSFKFYYYLPAGHSFSVDCIFIAHPGNYTKNLVSLINYQKRYELETLIFAILFLVFKDFSTIVSNFFFGFWFILIEIKTIFPVYKIKCFYSSRREKEFFIAFSSACLAFIALKVFHFRTN